MKLLNIDVMQISSHIECVYIYREIPWGQVSSTAIRVIIYVSNANKKHMFELVDPRCLAEFLSGKSHRSNHEP